MHALNVIYWPQAVHTTNRNATRTGVHVLRWMPHSHILAIVWKGFAQFWGPQFVNSMDIITCLISGVPARSVSIHSSMQVAACRCSVLTVHSFPAFRVTREVHAALSQERHPCTVCLSTRVLVQMKGCRCWDLLYWSAEYDRQCFLFSRNIG